MQNRYTGLVAACLGMVFLLVACARLQPQITVDSGLTSTISIQARSFNFEPNNLRAYQGDTLVFKITNTSKTVHNFTIKDPHGEIIQSIALPSEKTITLRMALRIPGIYEFYCDKPFHPTMGMKGQVQVVPR